MHIIFSCLTDIVLAFLLYDYEKKLNYIKNVHVVEDAQNRTVLGE